MGVYYIKAYIEWRISSQDTMYIDCPDIRKMVNFIPRKYIYCPAILCISSNAKNVSAVYNITFSLLKVIKISKHKWCLIKNTLKTVNGLYKM